MTGPAGAAGEDDLLGALGRIARTVDPIPDLTYELGRGVFSLRRIDDELAALVADSLTDAGAVRAQSADVRLVSFHAPDLAFEIQVLRAAGGNTVIGQLDGPAARSVAAVDLETPDGLLRTTPVDAEGRFAFDDVPGSLIRLRAVSASARVTSAWVHL